MYEEYMKNEANDNTLVPSCKGTTSSDELAELITDRTRKLEKAKKKYKKAKQKLKDTKRNSKKTLFGVSKSCKDEKKKVKKLRIRISCLEDELDAYRSEISKLKISLEKAEGNAVQEKQWLSAARCYDRLQYDNQQLKNIINLMLSKADARFVNDYARQMVEDVTFRDEAFLIESKRNEK